MSAPSADLRPLVDHHCHGLLLDDLDRLSFEALMNEAAGPSRLGTSFFDSMLGLAIRRWCAPVLGLEPHAPAEDYLARRRELGVESSRLLVAAAGIETFLVDTGLPDDRLCSPAQLAALSGGQALRGDSARSTSRGVDQHRYEAGRLRRDYAERSA